MILDRLIALYYWKSAKSLSKNDMAAAARRFLAAYDRQPTNERYATRALEVAAEAGLYPAAHRICCEQAARGDDLGYWTRYDSYITELEDAPAAPAVGSDLVALFNDTDRRPNIGCRLTSQSLKSVIARTLPQATIVSSGFRFSVFRSKPSPTEPNSRATIEKTLEAMVRTGYGADAVQQVRRSALVVLQPEGALDDDVDLRGLVIFFSPILLALVLGKSTAVVNGTIPSYDAERGTFLRDLFPLTGAVAGRDRFSAEAYGVRYIPDAGLLYQPPRFDEQRNACLITTGARNSVEDDRDICVKALAVCKEQRLRPIVLTRASSHFSDFVPEIRRMNGIFAETASLPVAAETLSQCSLHIGGRYHMAMLSLLCGVPSLLFDVKTGKNKWLSELSPLIRLVDGDGPLSQAAAEMLSQPKHEPPSRRDLAAEYANFMEEACRSAGGEQATAVQALLNRTGVIA